MDKKKSLILSGIFLGISVVFYIITYFFFHYLTDNGFTSIKQEEAGKPFVTNCVGMFATLCFFAAVLFLLIGLIVYKKKRTQD